MTRPLLRVAALLTFLLSPACGGDGGIANSPTAPSGPGGTAPAAGVWTGTLIRPGNLGTLSVRWEATTVNGDLQGPLTLTNGGVNVTVTARASVGGNDRQGYGIFISFNQNAGEAPTTGCAIIAATVQTPEGEAFPAPYNRIVIRGMDITYSGCRDGLISTGYSNPETNFLREIARLELSK